MRRLLPFLLFVLITGAAFAQPAASDDADAILIRARKLAPEDPSAAADLLVSLAEPNASSPGQRVRGTKLAFDLLPFESGNRVGAALVLASLRDNRSQPEAWQLAFRVRDRVMDGLDVVHGEPFLLSLIDLYPDQLRFQYYLADLYLDTGRPEAADRVCMEILRQTPDDTRARHLQAYICELDGRIEEALDLYSQVYRISGELEPLVYRVRILIEPVRDYTAAQKALDEAFAALEKAPAGRSRNAARADLEYEETRLGDERTRRTQLLEIAARQDRLVLVVLGAWALGLVGGVVYLRHRGLV